MDPITQTVRDTIDMVRNTVDVQNLVILAVTMVIGIVMQKTAAKVWKWCFTKAPEVPMKMYVQDIIKTLDEFPDKWYYTARRFGERITQVYAQSSTHLTVACAIGYDEHGDFYVTVGGIHVEDELTKAEKKAILASVKTMLDIKDKCKKMDDEVEVYTNARMLYAHLKHPQPMPAKTIEECCKPLADCGWVAKS